MADRILATSTLIEIPNNFLVFGKGQNGVTE